MLNCYFDKWMPRADALPMQGLEHLSFKHLKPVPAGSCIIDPKKRKVLCFGLSITLHLEADEKKIPGLLPCRYLVIKRIR